jgi:hypothetical protein
MVGGKHRDDDRPCPPPRRWEGFSFTDCEYDVGVEAELGVLTAGS